MSSTQVLNASSPATKHTLLSDALIDARQIVVLTGAGISCSAGIPDFRSKDGLYDLVQTHIEQSLTRQSSKNVGNSARERLKTLQTMQGKDLFSANVFRDPEQTALFYSFIASLYGASRDVQPTKTHAFIAKLAKKNKLLRCYTQNIDCLEERAGLTSVLDQPQASSSASVKGKKKFSGDVVRLHGRLDRLRCGCGYEGRDQGGWSQEVYDLLSVGEAAPCPDCARRAADRAQRSKRTIRSVGHFGNLKPAILLYDDPSPPSTAETILEIEQMDLERKVDFVLVMGTSLKVPGFKALVKDFIIEAKKQVSASGKNRSKVCAVLVNATNVLTSEWNSIFDYHVMDECDAFVDRVTKRWKSRKPDDWLQQPLFTTTRLATSSKSPTFTSAKGPSLFATSSQVKTKSVKRDEAVVDLPQRATTPPPMPSSRSLRKVPSIISIPSSPVRIGRKRQREAEPEPEEEDSEVQVLLVPNMDSPPTSPIFVVPLARKMKRNRA